MTSFNYRLLGLRLLLDSQLSRNPPHELRETTLPIDEGLPTDIYLPPEARRRKNGKHQKAMIFIHGMAPRGHRDERIISLSRILAGLGLIVVVPRLQEVADLYIQVESTRRIAEIIKIVAGDKTLCPAGRVGMLAPSFSGTLALTTAGRDDVTHLLSSLCTIGPAAEMLSSLDFFMGRPDADPYAYMIIFKNFLHFSVRNRQKVIEAMGLAAEDDGMHRADHERLLPDFLKTLSKKDRELFDELLTNRETRLKHWEAIRPKLAKHLEGSMPLQLLPNVQAALTLVHGIDDNVIAPDQSELLYTECQKLGKRAKLILTPLISHGDHSVRLSMIKDAYELAGGFGHFIENL